jgi:hypothetical protein
MIKILFRIIVICFGTALIVIGLLGKEELFRFLAPTQPVKASVLVIEGWIDEEALQQAISEILTHSYNQVLVTSIAHDSSFRMYSQGGLIFRLDEVEESITLFQQIQVLGFGSSAGGIQAHAKVLVDTMSVGEFTASDDPEWHSVLLDTPVQADSVVIVYDNNHLVGKEDRDLFIYKVCLGSNCIPARHAAVRYDRGKLDGKAVFRTNYRSEAEESAEFITQQGIDTSLVRSLTAPPVDYERTFTAALEVKRSLPSSVTAINVFSEGVHARRSQLVYQRMMGDSVQVGVVAASSRNQQPQNWWKEGGSRNYVLVQLAKYLYAKLFFFPSTED